MSKKIRIIIVEDNTAYAQSLEEIIKTSDDMSCAGMFSSIGECREALERPKGFKTDIILLDLKLPDGSGLSLIPVFSDLAPEAGVVVLTSNDDYETVLEAIKLGVVGYVLKDTPVGELRRIIREVHEGGGVIDSKLSRFVLNAFKEEAREPPESNTLSRREKEVLELMAKGCVKKEVAETLGISYSAIALYTSNIYQKLQVPNVAAAVAKAIRQGQI